MEPEEKKKRIYLLDILRGVLIIYVVYYHFMYDLNDILSHEIPYLYSRWFSAIRNVMSGSLIFISGISCNLSRNNLKRGIRTVIIALLLTLVTRAVMPSQTILFGILHLLGTMMLLYGIAELILKKRKPEGEAYKAGKMGRRILLSAVFLFLYAFFYNVYYGFLGIGGWRVRLPGWMYGSLPMYIVGFQGPFFSADYYPLLPWGMLFLAGAMAGYIFRKKDLPPWLYQNRCRPLAFLGRHTMAVYIIHQPLLFGIFFLIDRLF